VKGKLGEQSQNWLLMRSYSHPKVLGAHLPSSSFISARVGTFMPATIMAPQLDAAQRILVGADSASERVQTAFS